MRILLTVLLALAATAAHAQTDTIRKFAQSAQKWSGADPKRQEDTARYVKIRGKRLTNFIGAGAAWYSDLYDIVGVDRKYFGSDGKLKSLPEMHTEDCGGYINAVATIFHEMGHAEWDHFIEEKGGDAEDKTFYEVVTREIKPWIKANETRLNRMGAGRAPLEWHGYYLESLVSKILYDREKILLENGFIPCSLQLSVTKVKQLVETGTVPDSEFGKFRVELLPARGPREVNLDQDNKDIEYGKRIRGFNISIANQYTGIDALFRNLVDIDTDTWNVGRGFKDEWWDAIWNHTQAHYKFPASAVEPIWSPEDVRVSGTTRSSVTFPPLIS